MEIQLKPNPNKTVLASRKDLFSLLSFLEDGLPVSNVVSKSMYTYFHFPYGRQIFSTKFTDSFVCSCSVGYC